MITGSDLASTRRCTFRAVAGHVVAGVSVVTTLVDSEPVATTASSVVAASWDPPLLAVFFRAGSRMDRALDGAERFTINVLGEQDLGLARRFSSTDRRSGWEAFKGVKLAEREPLPPMIASAIAWADCAVVQIITVGDHRCFVGEIRDCDRDDAVAPLVYYRGRYRGLGPAIAPAIWAPIDDIDLTSAW